MKRQIAINLRDERSPHGDGRGLQRSIRFGIGRTCEQITALATFFAAIAVAATLGCTGSKDDSERELPEAAAKHAQDVTKDLPNPNVAVVTSSTTIGIANDKFVDHLADELARATVPSTEWKTENISAKTTSLLKKLLQSVIDNNQTSDLLKTNELAPNAPLVFDDNGLRVLRSSSESIGNLSSRGEPLREFMCPIRDAEIRFELKTVGVTIDDDGGGATTRVLISLLVEASSANSNIRRLQRNSQWKCTWQIEGADGLKLLSIESERFEQIESLNDLRFNDISDSVLTGALRGKQIKEGLDYWRQRIDWRFGIDVIGPHGIAVGDVNADGLDDVYYCEAGGLPNRLLIHQRDGTATDQAADAGVDLIEPTQSALFLDLDNDADQDLILASGRYVVLLANNGDGNFSRVEIKQFDSVIRSMSAADFDGNRFVDIYICGYFSRTPSSGVGLGRPMPYHDANNGTPNYLLANMGDWRFEDVTKQVGLDVNNQRFSYAAAWSDYDLDGDLDLYVANDFGRNNLYRNDHGTFKDVAAKSGVEDISAGMSASWSDFDRDGDFDIYVGNMYSSAGNRIAFQQGFQPNADDTSRKQLQRHARGNTLFRNDGAAFTDISLEANVTMGRWAWSSNLVDINNDGWDDVVVANGFVTNQNDTDDL